MDQHMEGFLFETVRSTAGTIRGMEPVGGLINPDKIGDYITPADRFTNETMIENLGSDFTVFAEEDSSIRPKADNFAVVDFDGTSNWRHGLPPFGINLAVGPYGNSVKVNKISYQIVFDIPNDKAYLTVDGKPFVIPNASEVYENARKHAN